MNADGDFIVVGRIARADGSLPWKGAIVSGKTEAPEFNQTGVYDVLRWIDVDDPGELGESVLHTLPLPLPANNYPMLFAPERRPGFPLHQAPVPDLREADGRRQRGPITLAQWLQARGTLHISIDKDNRSAQPRRTAGDRHPDGGGCWPAGRHERRDGLPRGAGRRRPAKVSFP